MSLPHGAMSAVSDCGIFLVYFFVNASTFQVYICRLHDVEGTWECFR